MHILRRTYRLWTLILLTLMMILFGPPTTRIAWFLWEYAFMLSTCCACPSVPCHSEDAFHFLPTVFYENGFLSKYWQSWFCFFPFISDCYLYGNKVMLCELKGNVFQCNHSTFGTFAHIFLGNFRRGQMALVKLAFY